MKKIVSVLFAILMLVFATIPAFAAENSVEGTVDSPVATTVPATTYTYEVDVVPTEGGDGSYEFTSEIDEEGKQHVHIIPKPNPGYTFDHWEIDGPYISEDEITDPQMDLIITGDITVTPYYKKQGSPTVATGTVSIDVNKTSPTTGSNDVFPYAVIMLSVVACGAAVVMLVRTNKSK